MLIYVGISSHGFGHAARQAAVLAALHRLQPHWRLVVSTAVDPNFLRVAFEGVPVEWRQRRWDVGMAQADALSADPQATLAELSALDAGLPAQIDEEARWLSAQNSPVVVVGDIPPSLAELALRLQAPLVWMGNFGWDDIYAPLGELFASYAERATQAYRQGDLLLRMPFDLAMDWGLPTIKIGLTAAQPRPLPEPVHQRLSERQQPTVLVGFGGLGLRIEPALCALWPHHHFVLAAPQAPDALPFLQQQANVTLLPAGVRPLDVMPFCERLLGKPGFSTFSETLSNRLGLHVVERDGFAEAAALKEGLRRHGRHRFLTRSALASGDWQLNQALISPTEEELAADGAVSAAKAIVAVAEHQSDWLRDNDQSCLFK